VLPHAKSGRLRALAITSAQRSRATPELPTVAESGVPGFETAQWYGIVVPAGTPDAAVTRLNAEAVKVVTDPELTARMSRDGTIPGRHHAAGIRDLLPQRGREMGEGDKDFRRKA
jgi:tripartite-type tricarboxylate transporter receptor subunit TctC